MENYEKLGSFYLGKEVDSKSQAVTDRLLLYDSKDLTTHAVCVGMTGSGKTGLCICLLEEAAIDGIPAIIIDPKGDMGNLLLTFPELRGTDFLPWIDPAEASKKNLSPAEYADQQAAQWQKGLAEWGQDGERIRRLREAAEFTLFTPGSSAGASISILHSFDAPAAEEREDVDLYRERISVTVTSLLGLIGTDADPIQSREHILLSSLFEHYWSAGKTLDLAALIQAVQTPPLKRIGVFEMESFYPSKERFQLAMALNNLLAAPGFSAWLEGEPLNVDRLLYSETGKPRVAIFSIAHLSDSERMFFVSLLLTQIIGWVRRQPGTGSLRAMLYFDEIFGYLPPISNPPAKAPLLTLLKQARAFGLGVVLATQNPVDLDYKALSNTGTWMIGRLQTERDRDRLLDGLMTAANPNLDRAQLGRMISGLNKRVFLLHNVHESAPVLFNTRWALSYLCGPLTRNQIKQLRPSRETAVPAPQKAVRNDAGTPPALPPEIAPLYLPVRKQKPADAVLVYQPLLWTQARVHYFDQSKKVDHVQATQLAAELREGPVPIDWTLAQRVEWVAEDMQNQGESSADYAPLPSAAAIAKNHTAWRNDAAEHLYRTARLTLFKNNRLNAYSLPQEDERDFRIRLAQVAREGRDQWSDELRKKYGVKIDRLKSKIQTAEERVDREKNQAQQQKLQSAISIGSTVLGAFLGRKRLSKTSVSRAGTAIKNAGRASKEATDVKQAEENLARLQLELQELENEFQQELESGADRFDALKEPLESFDLRPRKTDIQLDGFGLVWVPYWRQKDGKELPASF